MTKIQQLIFFSIVFFTCFIHAKVPNPCPVGFITLEECKKQQYPIQFLLQEDDRCEFVISFKNGIVVNQGGIITNTGKIFSDTETWKSDQQKLLAHKRNIAHEEYNFFDGTLVVLSSPGQENWYHWLLQVIPRLKILKESKILYDKIYINSMSYAWQKKSLAIVMQALEISDEKLLLINDDAIIQARELIVPSIAYIPSKEKYMSEWLKTFLHEMFIKPIDHIQPRERIYISRSNATVRRISNEEEVVTMLQRYNFMVLKLEELSAYEQAFYFKHADIIVGPHGSGFTNLVFAPPHITIIEIDHQLAGKEQRSCFKGMAESQECIYVPFYVDTVTEENIEQDMFVDIDQLEQLLQKIIHQSSM